MPSVATGSSVAIRESTEKQADPTSGYVLVETWKGTKSQIDAIEPGFIALGGRTKSVYKAALSTLTVTWPTEFGAAGGGGTEVPTEKWDTDIEWGQVDIRSAPKLLQLAAQSIDLVRTSAEQVLSKWVMESDAAIRAALSLDDHIKKKNRAIAADPKGKPSDLIPFPLPEAWHQVYNLRARGAEAYEVKRPVITRRRTYSETYPEPITVDAVEKVYTTPVLVSAFKVPELIQRKLPADPSYIPAETVWAWKLRKQDGTYTIARNKIEEVQDWVFAAWSTLLHDVAQ